MSGPRPLLLLVAVVCASAVRASAQGEDDGRALAQKAQSLQSMAGAPRVTLIGDSHTVGTFGRELDSMLRDLVPSLQPGGPGQARKPDLRGADAADRSFARLASGHRNRAARREHGELGQGRDLRYCRRARRWGTPASSSKAARPTGPAVRRALGAGGIPAAGQ